MANKRSVGAAYEALAAEFLKEKGYEIVQQNFRCGLGEIDLIARKDGILCFVEVKYRKSDAYGYPEEAVSPRKQATIRKVAEVYLTYRKLPLDTPCRFDVIGISGKEIRHSINAF